MPYSHKCAFLTPTQRIRNRTAPHTLILRNAIAVCRPRQTPEAPHPLAEAPRSMFWPRGKNLNGRPGKKCKQRCGNGHQSGATYQALVWLCGRLQFLCGSGTITASVANNVLDRQAPLTRTGICDTRLVAGSLHDATEGPLNIIANAVPPPAAAGHDRQRSRAESNH